MPSPAIVPHRTLRARCVAVLQPSASRADGEPHFLTERTPEAVLGFEGPQGASHSGWTRGADARTPWYTRGTRIRNIRQVSAVSVEDLVAMATALGVDEVKPEWLGANLLIEGIGDFSYLPRGTRIEAAGGAVLACEGYNFPCMQIGRAVAAQARGVTPQAVVKAASRRRGIVASVELPGAIRAGDTLTAHVPEQWLYS